MSVTWNESLPLYLDHTVLRPEATKADVLRLCAEAREQWERACARLRHQSAASAGNGAGAVLP